MQFGPAFLRSPSSVNRFVPSLSRTPGTVRFTGSYASPQANTEIHAYIAARDLSVADAERNVTDMTLNRAFLANELVENILQPSRSPYQRQSPPEADAITERKRCESVKRRISQLRACVSEAA